MSLSLGQAASKAGVSKPTIKNWIKAGKLSGTKADDGTYSIDPSELERVILYRKAEEKPKDTEETKVDDKPNFKGGTSIELEVLKAEKLALQEALRKSENMVERLMNQNEDLQEKYAEAVNRSQLLLEGPLKAVTEKKKFLGIF